MTMRTETEIRAEHDRPDPEDIMNGVTNVPGMTYEQGVDNALRWVLGYSDDQPYDD